MSKYRTCKFHKEQNCPWCRKWRKTYSYFRNRGCSELRLYCVEFKHYRTGERFYKLGLTSGTVEKRFKADAERFDIRVVHQQIFPIYQAVTEETSRLFNFHKQGRLYRPKARISGYTECFR